LKGTEIYRERFYRSWITTEDLVSFQVQEKESDLLIRTLSPLEKEARKILKKVRRDIEDYLKMDPLFGITLEPYHPVSDAPPVIKKMAKFARRVKVGPMAGVAGAVAEEVGMGLAEYSPEVIVENGGDIFILSRKKRRIKVYAGKDSPFRNLLTFNIYPEFTPVGICTSSGKVGHSLSLGNADAVVVISNSVILADVTATALGNRVKEERDIEKGIRWVSRIKGIRGALVIKDGKMGVWGDMELEEKTGKGGENLCPR